MNTAKSRINPTTAPVILGEQRSEKRIPLRPAPTAAQLRAALAAANIPIPQKPEKPAQTAGTGRRGRARIVLGESLREAFSSLGWDAPTRETTLIVPPACQIAPDAMKLPVPVQPAAWSVGAASLLTLAHGANGLLPVLSEGQTAPLSHLLIVAADLKARRGFPACRGGRTGDLGYVGSYELFFRALSLATRRMVALNFAQDTIRLESTRD